MKDFMSTEDLAERLGCSRQYVARLAKEGRIPFVREGRLILIPRLAWEQFVAQRTAEAMAALKQEKPNENE